METYDVLVVGAGLAGIAFGCDARDAGLRVGLLDKARGVGGRAGTRRWRDARLDHGAQFFTARGERLRALTEQWLRDGWLRVWSHGFPLWENGEVRERPPGHARFAPPAGMSALPKALSEGLEVYVGSRVTGLERDGQNWTARCEDGRAFTGKRLVLNLPPAQIVPLARDFLPSGVAPLEAVAIDPAWTLLLLLERDLGGVAWPALEVRHPVIAWVSRDHTKRPPGAALALAVHAQGDWSREHLEEEPDAVAPILSAALREVVGPVAVRDAQAHRWRYAQPTIVFPATHHWDPGLKLGWCGDWCGASRVEGALESGWALAKAMTGEGAPGA